MEQKQQGRRSGRRAVSDEPEQQRGLQEALLLPMAVTVLRTLTL